MRRLRIAQGGRRRGALLALALVTSCTGARPPAIAERATVPPVDARRELHSHMEIDATGLETAPNWSRPLRLFDASGAVRWRCEAPHVGSRLSCTVHPNGAHEPGHYRLAIPARGEPFRIVSLDLDGAEVRLVLTQYEDGLLLVERVREVPGSALERRDALTAQASLVVRLPAQDEWCTWGGLERLVEAWSGDAWRTTSQTAGCACAQCGSIEPLRDGDRMWIGGVDDDEHATWVRAEVELVRSGERGECTEAELRAHYRGLGPTEGARTAVADRWVVRGLLREVDSSAR